jgi:hypothetical protein
MEKSLWGTFSNRHFFRKALICLLCVLLTLALSPAAAFASNGAVSGSATSSSGTSGGYGVSALQPTAAPLRIMPLGNEVTIGKGSTIGLLKTGYRIALQEILKEANITYDFVGSARDGYGAYMDPDHEGHSGYRIDELTKKVDTWVRAAKPDVVLLQVGDEDCVQNYKLAEAPARLNTLIDKIRAASPGVKIVVSTVPHSSKAKVQARIVAYNTAARSVILSQFYAHGDVAIAEMTETLSINSDFDNYRYPDDSGYAKMGAVWAISLCNFYPAAYPAITAALRSMTPVTIMPYGGKETTGTGSGKASYKAGYRGFLYDLLRSDQLYFDFVGGENTGDKASMDVNHEGHTSYDTKNLADKALKLISKHEPAVVLVYAGTEDVEDNTKPAEAANRYRNVLNQIRAASPGVKIVAATLVDATTAKGQARVEAYNVAIRSVVAEQQAQYGDVWLAEMSGVVVGKAEHSSTYLPNDAGYAKMAQVWRVSLYRALGVI